ncbi:hypothetical protein B0H66DRAFT_41916 [Apodospora peruviana]|uniref:Uncharacterized protein n=1 Tax=Apodospora peruviana TaxID=516989 RepID=A0AAE0MEX6_9PEZI|nr:hypothetical protein B0H66DRAFT_41916 [Apodospora peruviana]
MTTTTALMSDLDSISSVKEKVRLKKRLGRYSIGLIGGGTLLILGCIAFLGFLWLSNENNSVWHDIVLSGWLTRSITIVAAVLRGVTAAQAVVATSVVASLLLHSAQTKLASAPAISIARFTNTGPHALLPHLHRRVAWVFWLLVGIMVAVAAALQLTSTLLLSGVGRGTIITNKTVTINYGIATRNLFTIPREQVGYLVHSKRSIGFPAFAEYAEAGGASTEQGIRDTGRSMRAFLPIPIQSTRESVLAYEGMATVLDTRVVCVRPKIEGLAISPPGNGSYIISGTISTNLEFPGARRAEKDRISSNFICSYVLFNKKSLFDDGSFQPDFPDDWDEEWPVRLCNVAAVQESMQSELFWPQLPLLGGFQPTRLLVHATGPYSTWTNAKDKLNVTNTHGSNEWLIAETNLGTSLRMTLCVSDIVAQDTVIQASRPVAVPEPVPTWNPAKFVYDVDPILTQLNASQALLSRGIFNLLPPSSGSFVRPLNVTTIANDGTVVPAPDETVPQHTYVIQAIVDLSDSVLGTNNPDGKGLSLCVYCVDGSSAHLFGTQLAPIPAAVFQGALRATDGNAAVAMQALLTTALGMSYYDLVDRFDTGTVAKITALLEVDVPTDGRFAVVVVVLLGLHLLLVAVVMVMLHTSKGDSLVGAAWDAVATVRGEEVDTWLEETKSCRMRDGELKKRMKAGRGGDVLVGMDGDGTLRLRGPVEGRPEE